ncbi:MAG: MBL fold metallo-hydrolase RNA specificity domain-containing protein [Oscillospiraceae bacterium]
MKMTFIGATHEVTGSCTYIEACGKRFLVDFGMEQGTDAYENKQIPTAPSNIDFVLLTHAHIDHSGLLPLLFAGGFKGEIHATKATCNLCDIMLRDSAHIQEFEAEWRNRKGRRKNQEEFVPLYTMNEAEGAIKLFSPHNYGEKFSVCDGIEVRFVDAGHLLGSASIEIWLTENGITKKAVFSGDIGNLDQPLIRDPQYIEEADYAIMESTYGNRIHEKPPDYASSLAKILEKTFERGGNVVIPSFAVGRTQELLYFIRQIKEKGLVKTHRDFPVYVDSPLAIEATEIFNRNRDSCFDEEAMDYINRGINPIRFDGLRIAVTSDESRAINFDDTPKVIISASGMCEAGRIKHHLKHNLWRSECTVLFVGYQAVNTLGRKICEGAKKVKLFGEEIVVNAEIQILPGISGHGDLNGLNRWISSIKAPQKVFVIHGESQVAEEFTAHLRHDLGLDAYCPYSGGELDLITGEFKNGKPVPIIRKPKGNSSYQRLTAALDRLSAIIGKSSGLTNKELAKMTDTINNLCSKWED